MLIECQWAYQLFIEGSFLQLLDGGYLHLLLAFCFYWFSNRTISSFFQSMVKDKRKERKASPTKENESSESEEEVSRPRKSRKRVDSDSDSDSEDDVNSVMKCLPENSAPLIEFANVSQGILLLLMLKQHLKNLCGFSDR